jgi:hypothetical protein
MRNRSLLGALLITGELLPITSCISSPSLTSIVVYPERDELLGSGTHYTADGSRIL